jgi:hypothetical protein
MSIDQALREAKRLKREREGRDLPLVILIVGCPEPARLGFDLKSERMALIKGELFEALPNETTKAFHRRLVVIARERSMGLNRGVITVSIGSDEPVKECLYHLDGTLKTPLVEGQAEPPGDATRH